PLGRMAEGLATPNTMPPLDIGIYDIMYLIARARAFTGSSLHGAITAMAYDVPHAPFANVPKVVNYLQTWDLPEHRRVVRPETLVDDVRRIMAVPAQRR